MYIDTHCHLNLKAFDGGESKVARRASEQGVKTIIIPGVDIPSSQKAIAIASALDSCYATVGIHPHHLYPYLADRESLERDIATIRSLAQQSDRVVAIGEVGYDRHTYRISKYGDDRSITDDDMLLQRDTLIQMIQLACSFDLALVIHNREAVDDLTETIESLSMTERDYLSQRLVLHCCEPSHRLLEMAMKYMFYIGVDGDVTYDQPKRDFIARVPHDQLVLETDAPYILPEPLRSQKKYPNLPEHIPLIAQSVAEIWQLPVDVVAHTTTSNATKLYHLPK